MDYTIQDVIKQQREFIYTGTALPLLKKEKWKQHKSLIIVQELKNGFVKVKRKDGKGCNSSGATSAVVHFYSLKDVQTEKTIESKQTAPEVPKALGMKYDNDKVEYSLLPTGVLQPVLRVLGFGAKKYSKENWKHVENSHERYYNAAMRHLTSWWEGEKKDPETGENHLAHAVCCLLFLLWFDNKDTGKN